MKIYLTGDCFAPAFAGPRHETKNIRGGERRQDLRRKEITKAKFIDALVFAYEDDDFNRPEELKF